MHSNQVEPVNHTGEETESNNLIPFILINGEQVTFSGKVSWLWATVLENHGVTKII